MARDINQVILTGMVCQAPALVRLKSGNQICIFRLKNIEKYELANGQPAAHDNILTIEVFGKAVERTMRDVRHGERYVINGYLRVDEIDGMERVRVRAFNIQRD